MVRRDGNRSAHPGHTTSKPESLKGCKVRIPMPSYDHLSKWTRFWHEPVRAERLAITRIFFALALLLDQLCQFLPDFADFYGPGGVGYAGLHDEFALSRWRWTILIFGTDNLTILYTVFFIWMGFTIGFLVGWHTR